VPAARAAEGVIASAITPRRRGLEEIDLSALWEIIDFLCARKVDGIALMGAAGEFIHFNLEERQRMMGLAVRRSRAPVFINVSHSTLDCALQLGEAAARAGAAGLLLNPPPFYRYDQSDLIAFYSVFHEHLGNHVPVYLCNIPAFASAIDTDTAAQLLSAGYAGVEDASGDWAWFESVKARSATKPIFTGDDRLFARARAAGAAGAISSAACAVPELLLAIDRAVTTNRPADATALSERLEEFVARTETFPVPLALREAAAVRGLKTGQPAAPLDAEKTRRLAEFRDWFKSWLPQVEKEAQPGAAYA
jgi:dihydrodipicolinate synthase/N-acetylneuraminate lyase